MRLLAIYAGFVMPDLSGIVSYSSHPEQDDAPPAKNLVGNIAIRAENRRRVLEFLVDGEATASVIAAGIGLTEKTTRLVLHDLVDERPTKVSVSQVRRVSVFSLVEELRGHQ